MVRRRSRAASSSDDEDSRREVKSRKRYESAPRKKRSQKLQFDDLNSKFYMEVVCSAWATLTALFWFGFVVVNLRTDKSRSCFIVDPAVEEKPAIHLDFYSVELCAAMCILLNILHPLTGRLYGLWLIDRRRSLEEIGSRSSNRMRKESHQRFLNLWHTVVMLNEWVPLLALDVPQAFLILLLSWRSEVTVFGCLTIAGQLGRGLLFSLKQRQFTRTPALDYSIFKHYAVLCVCLIGFYALSGVGSFHYNQEHLSDIFFFTVWLSGCAAIALGVFDIWQFFGASFVDWLW